MCNALRQESRAAGEIPDVEEITPPCAQYLICKMRVVVCLVLYWLAFGTGGPDVYRARRRKNLAAPAERDRGLR